MAQTMGDNSNVLAVFGGAILNIGIELLKVNWSYVGDVGLLVSKVFIMGAIGGIGGLCGKALWSYAYKYIKRKF